MRRKWPILLWLGTFSVVLLWSAISPRDYYTWLLEVLPALIGIFVLGVTRRKFPLTPLSYTLILAHSIVLMIGGHYTYAEVPVGDWLRDLLDQERNNYDKLGHFTQGFVPAILTRELLLRLRVVNGRRWLATISVCVCLAISAVYELIEWWVALLNAQAAESFLGMQGYAWDTQSDMLWALVGAMAALVLLARTHDRQLKRFS